MRDVPIIFSAPMVLALLREADKPGTGKSQTRRLLYVPRKFKGALPASFTALRGHPLPRSPLLAVGQCWTLSGWQNVKPGDRLWVRETVMPVAETSAQGYPRGIWAHYRADNASVVGNRVVMKATPSIHMPRSFSRLTLVITGTKIERLQKISDADAIAEGVVEDDGSEPDIFYLPGSHLIAGVNAPKHPVPIGQHGRPSLVFRDLWRTLNGDDAWTSNPEVVALAFTVHRLNIDAMRAAA